MPVGSVGEDGGFVGNDFPRNEKAITVAKGLTDKPAFLIEVFRALYEADPPVKITSSWSNRNGRHRRYNLLSAGEEVSILTMSGDRWVWIAHTSEGRINGEAPTFRIALKAVEHFLVEDGWTLAGPTGEDAVEREDGETDKDPPCPIDKDFQNPKDEDDGDDIPF